MMEKRKFVGNLKLQRDLFLQTDSQLSSNVFALIHNTSMYLILLYLFTIDLIR